ncbi:M48 family metalloprotease [Solirubrobacter sp. CPCC 204708]|uniref:M48 family metalloprotease n=1 Tax=Solirubrobacter deserti TaxID=2282478 RepID=A0ABT4RCL5_9ACTN|nr:M48 family metalloprotease [Solirubrobacter deserti]MBE2315626.1 M48 family metalloprotease [Solirubrobacter deserti]MDA0136265.1 M48 family metalloprotease [Solirubrobacter deserti]
MTALLVAAALAVCAIALPHALRLDHAPAGFAAAIWLSALLLRALASIGAVVAIEVYLPVTGPLEPFGAWCAGALSSHTLTDALFALPALVLAGSLVAGIVALVRAHRHVDALVREYAVGTGPDGSVVLGDGELLIAAAGPRVLVSAGALVTLDDAELRAGLEHERGHIVLRHRYLLIAGELARAVARFVPGTSAAARELTFALERHADLYALSRRHDPAVLASAICKTARGSLRAPALSLGGGVVARRARLLLEADPEAKPPRAHPGLFALAPLMVALVLVGALALPFAAHAGYHEKHRLGTPHTCHASDAA